jgi:hypothetical protein
MASWGIKDVISFSGLVASAAYHLRSSTYHFDAHKHIPGVSPRSGPVQRQYRFVALYAVLQQYGGPLPRLTPSIGGDIFSHGVNEYSHWGNEISHQSTQRYFLHAI